MRPSRRVLAPFAALAIVASACSGLGSPTPSGGSPSAGPSGPALSAAPSGPASSDAIASLAAAARAEGGLTTIALGHDWCNYGEALTTFTQTYGIPIREVNPDASFGDQIDAIKANQDVPGPDTPDVIDVAPSFAAQAKTAKLIQPYKVTTWDDIPATAKDPDGYWAGDYYGVLAFETNAARVNNPPLDWSDLLDAGHHGQVALPGDPRVNTQATQAVYAAALANGGSLDNAAPGLDFFKALKDKGNLLDSIAKPSSIESGMTPITIRWTYNALTHRDSVNGVPQIDVAIPSRARLGGTYAQAISAFAPHPNAAKLWLEFLYSDTGQNILLKGYCIPLRYDAMTRANMIPSELAAKVPDTTGVVFPSVAQLAKATDLITKNWDRVVTLDIH